MRLDRDLTKIILIQHEGFSKRTSYDSRNHEYERIYRVENGELHIREIGKTSWSDSRYDKEWTADYDETRRFIHKYLE